MKKYKDYLIVSGIVLVIFFTIFIFKGIYPFGDYTIAFSDMQAQIIDFYYHFRSSIIGNSSLFIDFNTSWGTDFFSQFVHYINSPFTLLTLIIPKSDVYKCVSLITMFKFLTASLTSLYFFKYYFKKINSFGLISLSLMYTFCGYGLVLYQITMWLDMFYLFPIFVIGIKKILDLESSKLYLIMLLFCLITNFYLTLITLIFVFLISYLYLKILKRENMKKAFISLVITTLLGVLISCVLLVPAFIQIISSERTIINLSNLANSRFGNLPDKIHYFLYSGVSIALSIKLISKYKSHKKEVRFFVLSMLLLLIPVFIEPVNLLIHFGSYYSFPLRYNFITLFSFIVALAYYLENFNYEKKKFLYKNIIYFGIIISILIILINTIKNYYDIQYAVYTLTLDGALDTFICCLGVMFLIMFLFLLVSSFMKNRNKFCVCIFIFTLSTSIIYAYNYIGIDNGLEFNSNLQEGFIFLSDEMYHENPFAIKVSSNINVNSGNVINNKVGYSFSSFTQKTSSLANRYFGYTVNPNINTSIGGTYFSDSLLGYKYLLSYFDVNSEYYKYLDNDYYYYYEFKPNISYGYVFDEKKLREIGEDSAFKNQNEIYKIWYDEDLFEVMEFEPIINNNQTYTAKLNIKNKKSVYLELLHDYRAMNNKSINGCVDIYVNNELFYGGFPNVDSNGLLYIGTFDDEEIIVEIRANASANLKYFNIGIMDDYKWLKFLDEQRIPEYEIEFYRNRVSIKISSEEGKMLFMPINYSNEYIMKLNNEEQNISKIFGNYIGIRLQDGENDIEIVYIPKGLKVGILITIISFIITFLIYKFNVINKLQNSEIMRVIINLIANVLFYICLIFLYVIPIICFIISLFVFIKI